MVTSASYHATQDNHVPTSVSVYRDRVATAVYVTTNYQQFKFDFTNRPVNEDKLARLYDAIAAKNLLADNPILVSLDFVILDGQHRIKVAEALGVPIYYQFASDTSIDDVPGLNSKRSSWKLTDYLHSWCARGNEDYLLLRDFIKRYDWMLTSMAVDLCYFGDKLGIRQDIAEGRYKCNNLDFATKVANALLDFRTTGFEYWRSRVFVYAVSNLIANAEYDHSRMMAKLRYNPQALRPAVTVDGYFDIFTNIYNYRTREDNRIVLRKLPTNSANYRADKKAERKAAQAQ